MTCWRSCRTALGIHIIKVFAYLAQLRTFQCHTLRYPVFGYRPSFIHHFLRSGHYRQPVVTQLHALTAAHKQPSATVLAHHMARVYVLHLQVDGVAPRTIRTLGPHHIVGTRSGSHREINVIPVFVFADVGSPHTAQIRLQCVTNRFPVHQITTMPHRKSWLIVESRVRHVVVFALTHDGGIGIVATQYRIDIGLCLCRQHHCQQNTDTGHESFHFSFYHF